MHKNEPQEDKLAKEREPIKFGYGASIVFLVFIAFVIYVSIGR